MGGTGSGRQWHLGAKHTTEDYPSIDIRRWKRDGRLSNHNRFIWQWLSRGNINAEIFVSVESDRVILNYRHRGHGEEWKSKSYPVYLEWSDCNIGGKRPWFLCPAKGCNRRVALLYSAGIFACRDCHKLAYPSQREANDKRAGRKANRIREKLDWDYGILSQRGRKPKGMHWDTYLRLTSEYDRLAQTSLKGIATRFNLLDVLKED